MSYTKRITELYLGKSYFLAAPTIPLAALAVFKGFVPAALALASITAAIGSGDTYWRKKVTTEPCDRPDTVEFIIGYECPEDRPR